MVSLRLFYILNSRFPHPASLPAFGYSMVRRLMKSADAKYDVKQLE